MLRCSTHRSRLHDILSNERLLSRVDLFSFHYLQNHSKLLSSETSSSSISVNNYLSCEKSFSVETSSLTVERLGGDLCSICLAFLSEPCWLETERFRHFRNYLSVSVTAY